jgi:hypothetical protein
LGHSNQLNLPVQYLLIWECKDSFGGHFSKIQGYYLVSAPYFGRFAAS